MGVQSTDSGSPGDGSPIGRRLLLGMAD